MTRDDFKEWFSYHAARFPGVRTWMAKQESNGTNPNDILDAWEIRLRFTDLRDAKKASDAMFEDAALTPSYYEKHAPTVAMIAQKYAAKPTYIDGQRTALCGDCGDDGYVLCWHPESIKAARKGELKRLTMAVCCHCDTGESRKEGINKRHPETVPHYDPQKWRMIRGPITPEEETEFMEWARTLGMQQAYEEFSQFE